LVANATGEVEFGPLRLQFDRSVKLAFRGSSICFDGGLRLHRELDGALGLTRHGGGIGRRSAYLREWTTSPRGAAAPVRFLAAGRLRGRE
jgi:hypothetical protein